MRRERVDLRVLPAEKELWQREADVRGLGLSELIRRAVEDFLRAEEERRDGPIRLRLGG